MRKYLIGSFIFLIVFGLVFWRTKKTNAPILTDSQIRLEPLQEAPFISEPMPDLLMQNKLEWQAPMNRAKERVTKKPFGIYIDLKNSPVQLERFSGYHVGTDFEVFPEELSVPVTVSSVCAGKLLEKKTATGYGGLVVQVCELNNQPVTVIYGHLKLSSIVQKVGDVLELGESIGVLGADRSLETDKERKHLHLAMHKGLGVNLLGYVQSENEIENWIDPCLYVCD